MFSPGLRRASGVYIYVIPWVSGEPPEKCNTPYFFQLGFPAKNLPASRYIQTVYWASQGPKQMLVSGGPPVSRP